MIQLKVIAPELTVCERLGAKSTIGVEACVGLKVEIEMFSTSVRSSNHTLDAVVPIGEHSTH
jgi:hypothetical protein